MRADTQALTYSTNPEKTFDCFCVGDIIYDSVFLLGKSASEITYGGTNYSTHVKSSPGGVGNIAAGIAALGGSAYLLGRAGRDIFAEMYAYDLRQQDIGYHIVLDSQDSTGLVVSLVDPSGERTLILNRGANDNLSIQEVLPVLSSVRARFFFTTGYSLYANPQSETILRILKHFKKLGTTTVFDPGSYNIIGARRDSFEEALVSSDIVLPNEREALALSDERELKQALEMLSRDRLLIVKNGRRGCQLIRNGEVRHFPGIKAKVVDTTGAGDAFAAALIYGLARAYELEDALKLAIWFSGKKVELLGPRSFPPSTAISAFLHEIEKNSKILSREAEIR